MHYRFCLFKEVEPHVDKRLYIKNSVILIKTTEAELYN